jgi:hypothetical protein
VEGWLRERSRDPFQGLYLARRRIECEVRKAPSPVIVELTALAVEGRFRPADRPSVDWAGMTGWIILQNRFLELVIPAHRPVVR